MLLALSTRSLRRQLLVQSCHTRCGQSGGGGTHSVSIIARVKPKKLQQNTIPKEGNDVFRCHVKLIPQACHRLSQLQHQAPPCETAAAG